MCDLTPFSFPPPLRHPLPRTLQVTYADEAFYIGAAAAKDSYLRKDKIIDIARRAGATVSARW